jgi:hypothetical protein
MTVAELIDALTKDCHDDDRVEVWEPEVMEWLTVSHVTSHDGTTHLHLKMPKERS